MTVNTIEAKARRILGDTFAEYRWSHAEIRDAVQMGVHALHAVRPSTRYVNGLLVDFVALPESDDDTMQIDPRYEEALVYFVCYRCYIDDDTDTVNAALADSYLGKFNTKAQL